MFFPSNRFIKTSVYSIALLLSALAVMSCSKLQNDVASFSEKVREKFQSNRKETVTASSLNLRKGPSIQSPSLKVLRKGEKLEIYHLSGKWAKVQTYEGKEGWVYTRYITGFEELFAEKQQMNASSKSSRTSKSKQPISPEEATVDQEIASGDETGQQTAEIKAEDGSQPTYSPEKPSAIDSSTDVNDAASQPDPGSEIESIKSSTIPELEPDEEAENTITSIQKIKNPTAEDGQLLFSHPEGLFSLSIPASWEKNTNNSNFFENYIFKDPLQEIEIWVTNTFAEDYSEDEFYRDLASLLMERSGGQTEISPAIRKKGESGHEWFFGKVEIKSEPIQTYKYWIKEYEGRFWAITEVYPQTSTDTASNKLFEIRRSFSFGAKPEPDHK